MSNPERPPARGSRLYVFYLMRTVILIIASVLLILGGFGLYMRMQPNRPLPPEAIVPKSFSATTSTVDGNLTGGVLPGQGVWILQFDEKTGRLVSRFRADQYFPQPSGVIHCTNPQAEFFLSSGQRVKLTGIDGDMVMKDRPDVRHGFVKTGPTGPPNRGRINHVTIKLYDSLNTDDEKHVIITMTTNNIDFDNDTFLITTQEYIAPDGSRIAPDQVPVHMVGDYEFDGKGLTLRWNDRDGRLELLEIAHGEKLTILHPSKTQIGPKGNPSSEPAASSASAKVDLPILLPAEAIENSALADADGSAAGKVLTPATRKAATRRSQGGRKPSTQPDHTVYQANFYDNVHITQGDQSSAQAEILRLHFMLKSQPADDTTQPTTRDAGGGQTGDGARPSAIAGAPTTQPVIIADGSIDASANPPRSPATRPVRAATQPAADVPVVITWTGRLVVAPTPTPPPRPVAPGAALIELLGVNDQIWVRRAGAPGQDTSEAHCASLLYQSADGSALLRSSPAYPKVVLKRIPDPTVAATRPANTPLANVECETLDYRALEHTATLLGVGHAVVPITSDAKAAPTTVPATQPVVPPVLDAKWQKQAEFFFVPGAADDMSIQRATFDGNVDILHPQLALKAHSLDLTFEPAPPTTRPSASRPAPSEADSTGPATRPAKSSGPELSNMVATGDVHCTLLNGEGKAQHIDSQSLKLQMARDEARKSFPHLVNAKGAVHASDESQDLWAEQMDLTLRPALTKDKPTTAPASGEKLATAASQPSPGATGSVDTSAVELEQMIARENVKVTNREGSSATGDKLQVDMKGEDPHVTLTGGDHFAEVMDTKKNKVSGPTILVDPHQQMAHVVGPGTLHVIRDTPPGGKPPAPTNVVWADHADINGNANRVDVYGNVVTTSADADGTINTASGDRVRIDLEDTPAPATKPTTKPASVGSAGSGSTHAAATTAATEPAARHHKAATTQPSPLQMDLFKNKQPSAITLIDNAVVRSSLTAANGDILREFELKAPTVFYAIEATSDLPAHSLLVPSAGQMLTRDNRDPATQPATAPTKKAGAAKDDNTELASSRGATAFQWQKQLLYTEDTHEAVMTGDVVVVHEAADGKQLPVRLTSDQVMAYFAPTETKKPTTRATQPADTRPAAEGQQALQLKSVRAKGHVIVTRGTAELIGDRLDYDPTSKWLIVHGSQQTPAVFSDPSSKSENTADVIWWNTVTWDIKATGIRSRR